MLILTVDVHVVPACVEAFIEATMLNVRASREEEGILSFELARDPEDPGRFLLLEIYATPEAVGAHKDTAHYKTWRETVAPMMAQPRVGRTYSAVE